MSGRLASGIVDLDMPQAALLNSAARM